MWRAIHDIHFISLSIWTINIFVHVLIFLTPLRSFSIDLTAMLSGVPVDIPPPTGIALVAAGVSLLIKEGLYRVTNKIALEQHSSLLASNAWHHRSGEE